MRHAQPTILKKASDPLHGTPISTVFDDKGLHVFYVSAADQRIHHLREGAAWAEEMFDQTWGSLHGIVGSTNKEKGGSFEAYVLTAERVILQVDDGGDRRELGKVDKDGKLVPSTTAECFSVLGFFMVSFSLNVSVQRRRKRICWY